MKISTLLEVEQEFLPREGTTAESIAKQIVQRAKEEAYKRGRKDPPAIKKLAEIMANRFANNVHTAIDQELGFSTMKDVRSSQ